MLAGFEAVYVPTGLQCGAKMKYFITNILLLDLNMRTPFDSNRTPSYFTVF